MFRVQRAAAGKDAWQTICTNASEAYARKTYEKQLQLNSVGRFRLLGPAGEVLAEAAAQPLFRRDDGEEQGQRTYYIPEPAAPRPG
jgi:hypothetical protein